MQVHSRVHQHRAGEWPAEAAPAPHPPPRPGAFLTSLSPLLPASHPQLCGIYKPGRAAVSLSSVKAAQSLCRQRLAMLTPLFQQHAAQVELMSVAATAGGRASVVPAVGSVAGASAPSGDTPMAGIHE